MAASFGALGLTLFLAFGLYASQAARQESERASLTLLDHAADTIAQRLDADMAERLREISRLASFESARDDALDPPAWRATLEHLQGTLPEYSWIGVADARGTVLAATGGLLEGQDVSQRPWFQRGRQGPIVQDVHDALLLAKLLPRPASGEPPRVVDVAAPLRLEQGQIGVIGAHLDWRWAEARRQELLASFDASLALTMHLTEQDGRVILGPTDTAPAPPQGPGMQGGGNLTHLVAYRPSRAKPPYPGMGWTVVVSQPRAVAFAAADRLQRQLLGLGLIGAVSFAALGWWLAGALTAPLRAAARQAREVLPADAPQRHHDEVAQLSASLSTLASGLRRREDEIQALSSSVEETVRQRTSGLADRNEQLMVFRRSITHDLRGPLGQMALLLRMLLAREGDRFPAEARRQVDVVARECERLSHLTDEMLALAIAEERGLALQTVDHAGLVEEVLQPLRATWAGRPPQVDMSALPVSRGDAGMLRQVWANLLSNAFKYSAKVDAPRIEIRGRVEGSEAHFTVADNGAGFDPADAPRLFQAFGRLHPVQEFEGTGLGLNIVQRIVQRHGGRIWAESQPGAGARFHVVLPLQGPPGQAGPGTAAAAGRVTGAHAGHPG